MPRPAAPPAGLEFLRRLDTRCWVPARLHPATLVVIDRVVPRTGAESFAMTMITAMFEIYAGDWTRPTPRASTIDKGLATAVARRRERQTGDLVSDAIDALGWAPLVQRDVASMLLYDLTQFGLREALALLLDDHPELAAAPKMSAYFDRTALKISQVFADHAEQITAGLAEVAKERGYLGAIAEGNRLRWGTPEGDSMRQIRGAIGWRRDVPGGPGVRAETAILHALAHGEPHPDDAAETLLDLADRNRTGKRNPRSHPQSVAARLYRAATTYRPDAPEIWARLGECLAAAATSTSAAREAVAALARARELGADDGRTWYVEARCRARLGEADLAIAALRATIARAGEPARRTAASDPHFAKLRALPELRALLDGSSS